MYSKLILLTVALLASGCSLRLNEEVVQTSMQVNPSGCLSNTAPLMERYFSGSAEEAEVQSFWGCVDKAVVTFSENTKGADAEQFSGPELSGFLSKYFLNGKIIDPGLVNEFMLLKQGMLGGSATHVSRAELRQLREIFRSAGTASLRLRTHMPVRVSTYLDRGYTPAQFEEAMQAFQASLSAIGQVMEKNQGTYSFERLTNFLVELKKFSYPEQQLPREVWVDTAINWARALRQAKSVFVAPPKEEIRAQDWARIYHLAPRYYSVYLRAYFYVKFADSAYYTRGAGLVSLEKFFSDVVELLELAVDNHPNGTIDSTEIDELIHALAEGGLLPTKQGDAAKAEETAKAFVRTLFSRLFASQGVREGYSITRANTDRLKESFRFGTEGLRAIDAAFRLETGDTPTTIFPEQIARISDATLLEATALKNDTSRAAIRALKTSLAEVKTIFPGGSNVVYIPERAPLLRISHAHAAKLHLLYSLNRLLLQAYGAKNDHLTEGEISTLADDVFPMLQELSLVSAASRASVTKRLFEASLFLYSSDGDTNLNMTEALELESLLLSTLMRGGKLHEQLAKICIPDEKDRKVDERGKVLIPAECFRKNFLDHQETTWAYIPGLAKFFESKPRAEQEKIFAQMEKFLRKDRTTQDFTMSDTYSFILLPYYVELLFSRFDADRNGLLDNKESEKAYPVFRPFLAKKAAEHGLNSAEDHHAVYMFLLGYQTLPTDMKLTWVWRRYISGAKDFKVNRGQVVQIFEKLMAPDTAAAKP